MSPLMEWMDGQIPKVRDKCLVKVERLAELGYELRRPEADFLRDGIYELRVNHQRVRYRMLYFFHGETAVLSHGLAKRDVVPDREIEKAIENHRKYEADPEGCTYKEETHDKEEEDQ